MTAKTSGAFFVVVGITFIAAGLLQGHTAFIGVGAAFLVLGSGIAAKGRRLRR